jgi:hypothetical protein
VAVGKEGSTKVGSRRCDLERETPGMEPGSLAREMKSAGSAPRADIPAELRAAAREAHGWLRSGVFAISAGIVAPIVCLALQQVILSGEEFQMPGLRFINVFWLFGYGVIGLEMAVLALRLAFGTKLGSWNGPIAGVLLVGALFAGGLGLVLLPDSILGLMVLIGALGFVPFLTSAAYFANATEAYRDARRVAGGPRLVASAFVGALLVIGVPGVVQAGVSLAVRSAIREIADGNPAGLAKLRTLSQLGARDRLVWAYAAEYDPIRGQRIADAYKELTGEDVSVRLARLQAD